MIKHPAVETAVTSCVYRSAGRGLMVGLSSKCLVTGGKRIHKLCRISPARQPGASGLGLAFKITRSLAVLRSPRGIPVQLL